MNFIIKGICYFDKVVIGGCVLGIYPAPISTASIILIELKGRKQYIPGS